MDVAILFSGGKDSIAAYEYAKEKNWNVKYLLSVKPNRRDCYLFHYATVEMTKEISKILNEKHIYITCDVADAEREAKLVEEVIVENKVDAVILGGVGLQETQLRTLQETLLPHGVEVFAAHAGQDHGELMKDLIQRGYEIVISQIASDGLKDWLGATLTLGSFYKLKEASKKFGFHLGFEGGYADTLVVDGPIFNKRLELTDVSKVYESEYNGYVKVNNYDITSKKIESSMK